MNIIILLLIFLGGAMIGSILSLLIAAIGISNREEDIYNKGIERGLAIAQIKTKKENK